MITKNLVSKVVAGLIFSLIVLPFFSIAQETPKSEMPEHIEDFAVHIELNKDGSVLIQEEILYNFGALELHGIYRKIPIFTRTAEGKERSISISSITVSNGKGERWQAKVNEGVNFFEIKIGDPDVLIKGRQLYVIRYTVWGAISELPAADEFYWNLTGNDWPIPIALVKAEVILPKELLQTQLAANCWSGALGENEQCIMAVEEGVATGTIKGIKFFKEGLQANGGLTVAVAIPKGLININSKQKDVAASIGWFKKWKIDMGILIPFIVFFALLRRWWTHGRDPNGSGVIVTQFDIPHNIGILEASAILDNNVKPAAISAAIIGLAIKKYLKIARIENKGLIFTSHDYMITNLKAADSKLSENEHLIMTELFSIGTVMIKDLNNKFSSLKTTIEENTINSLTDKGFIEPNSEKIKIQYVIAGFALMFLSGFIPLIQLGIFITGIIIACFGFIMPKRTQKGALMREQLLGFKQYLDVAEKDRINFENAPEKNPSVFEKFLPYAMIFGVEKAWASQFDELFEDNNKYAPSWYAGTNGFVPSAFASEVHGFGSATAVAFSPAGGASNSGGGGFSGGGGGGGGGGSW